MMNKFETKLTRYLTEQRVSFQLLPHQSPAITIDDAARQRGVRPAQMVKSILLRDMGNLYALACAPGDKSVDPKKVRSLLDCRRMTCVDLSMVEELTGYQIGTVTPLLLPINMPIIFDNQILNESKVTISSGSNMAGLALHRDDLIRLCNPIFADICR
ncbi:YbaK/EbsC family protein [Vibrio sp. Isolate25]|uniref:aminoacyl-tRNA deacylase n=1 Tax=unclassified Vibrio TaxID=2614977 RepID=UPI001EFEA482|nr:MULTISPECIES: YbaK/EbsC family protein [unclassified Vibrio]MCG9598313.1 YbaK/EbsC family protein [Vibrio sp. Isolate25]MCG9680028.1 YbaK/EbsC family protein [Vibrio sp. Isolate24]